MHEERKDTIKDVAAQREPDFRVILEDIHDPHNAGAIQRTCEAFGTQHLHFIFDEEEPYDPQEAGAGSAASAEKWLSFHTHQSIQECFNTLHEQDYTIIATEADARGTSIFNTSLEDEKIAIAVGNEHHGLSDTALQLSDSIVHIPIGGMVQSLNVSVAAAIYIYEIARQRNASGDDFTLDNQKLEQVIQKLQEKSTK